MKTVIPVLTITLIASFALAQSKPAGAPARPDDPRAVDLRPSTSRPADRGAQPSSRPVRGIAEVLNSRVPQVDFEQAPLETVMQWVEEYTGRLVYVRWPVLEEAGIARDTLISIHARDRKLSLILWLMLNEAAGASGVTLAYQATDELILFSTDKDLNSELITRIYDPRDITVDIPKLPFGGEDRVYRTKVKRVWPPPPPPPSPGGGLTPPARVPPQINPEHPGRDEQLQEFVELILCTIEPESWDVNGGPGTVFPYKGKIIVRNTRYVHQLIAGSREP